MIKQLLQQAIFNGKTDVLKLDIASFADDLSLTLELAMKAMGHTASSYDEGNTMDSEAADGGSLPRVIRFPYSRHSSYPELCHLVSLFNPRDVWPCTVDYDEWTQNSKALPHALHPQPSQA